MTLHMLHNGGERVVNACALSPSLIMKVGVSLMMRK